jgi:hypothetical protein
LISSQIDHVLVLVSSSAHSLTLLKHFLSDTSLSRLLFSLPVFFRQDQQL